MTDPELNTFDGNGSISVMRKAPAACEGGYVLYEKYVIDIFNLIGDYGNPIVKTYVGKEEVLMKHTEFKAEWMQEKYVQATNRFSELPDDVQDEFVRILEDLTTPEEMEEWRDMEYDE